jgi:hypothetical protein
MKAFFELHIEQGPILEAEGKDIGVVTHGQGLRWIQCTVTGKESHTGSTPMPMRRNAGRGLARITELVHEIAMKHQPNAVGAIGHIDIYPNSRNIIPGKAVFTIDFRSHVIETLLAMVAEFDERAPALCEEIGVSLETEIVGQFDPPAFDEGCVKAVRDAAERLGYSHMDIVSGAGHDACWINKVAPTSMVMCPCVDGLSHNEDEEISPNLNVPEWAEKGCNVLFQATLWWRRRRSSWSRLRGQEGEAMAKTPEARGEVTNALIFETLKSMQATLAEHSEDLREIKGRIGILEAQYTPAFPTGSTASTIASRASRSGSTSSKADDAPCALLHGNPDGAPAGCSCMAPPAIDRRDPARRRHATL